MIPDQPSRNEQLDAYFALLSASKNFSALLQKNVLISGLSTPARSLSSLESLHAETPVSGEVPHIETPLDELD
jgi:hypothetical protein